MPSVVYRIVAPVVVLVMVTAPVEVMLIVGVLHKGALYVSDVTVELIPFRIATALIVTGKVMLSMLKGPVYGVLEAVGAEPSVV